MRSGWVKAEGLHAFSFGIMMKVKKFAIFGVGGTAHEQFIDDDAFAAVCYQARRLEELEKLYKDEQVTRKRYFNQVGSSECPQRRELEKSGQGHPGLSKGREWWHDDFI